MEWGLGAGFPWQQVFPLGAGGGGALLAWCIHVALAFSRNATKIFKPEPQTFPLGSGESPVRGGAL